MEFSGIVIGLGSFLVIGLFHPVVIWAEYHWSKKCWPLFLLVGLGLLGVSLVIESQLLCALIGVTGFSCLWSIKELFEQERRVKKGWFPANPAREKETELML